MVSILTSSHFPSPQPPLSPIQPPTPPHVPPAPLQDPPLTPPQPPNRRFKASQVTALTVASLPPCRSDRYWRLQFSRGRPPRASTGDVHQSSSVDAGEAVGLAAAVGEFSPSSSSSSSSSKKEGESNVPSPHICNCCRPGEGFSSTKYSLT